MNIAQKLKKLRDFRGISQNKLIEEIEKTQGVSIAISSIRNYENTTSPRIPQADALLALARYYDVTVEYLIDDIRYENGLIFKTEKEAEKYAEYREAKKEHTHNFSNEEWRNLKIKKWTIYFDPIYNFQHGFGVLYRETTKYLGELYFESKEKAQEFINKYRDQILKYEFKDRFDRREKWIQKD